MKNILILSVLIVLVSCTKKSDKMYMPAEWEPHSAVWLGWEDENVQFHPVIAELIKTIKPHVEIKISVASDSLLRCAKKYLSTQSIDTTEIKFYVIPGDRYWIRDYGAAFLVNDQGDLGMADFVYNLNGKEQWIKEKYENQEDSISKYIDKDIFKKATSVDSMMSVIEHAQVLKTSVIHEGGAIEINGKGTLILCESTVFYRNPDWEKSDLENEFKRVLGVSNIIWLKQGLADDPQSYYRRITGNYVGGGVGGHTDEFVRFANPNTILLAWVDENERSENPINEMNYLRMSENLAILEKSEDQNGNPFTIIKVPLPDLITKKIVARSKIEDWKTTFDLTVDSFKQDEAPQVGDTLLRVPAASYMNYLVTNGLVVLPKYSQVGSSVEKENLVHKIFQEQFPNRKIKFIDAMPQNWSGGGIHCSTQQLPKL